MKILIAYSSKTGSTAEIAQAIGEVISQKGADVDVMPVKAVSNLAGYQAVIAGSAIRMGKWTGEAVNFVQKNQSQLSQMPVVYFTVHMLNLGDDPESVQMRQAYTAPVRQILSPKSEVFFAGRMDLSKLSFLEKLIAKAVKAVDQDLRDWKLIRGWAEEIAPALGIG